jgi:hypothetical protein
MAIVAEILGVKLVGLDILRTVYLYAAFGLATGIVVGAFRPIAATDWGAGLIGGIIGIPFTLVVRTVAVGWGDWRLSDILFAAIFMSACSVCAVAFRRGYRRAEKRSSSERST